MSEHQTRPDLRNYYRLPLVDDARDSITLLRIEPTHDGTVRVHLHRGVDSTSFSLRPSSATGPVWRVVAEPKLTVLAPARDTPGLTGPEQALAEVGEFLSSAVVGDGGVYRWGFEGLLPNDEWVLHLTQLAGLHERLEPARRSRVADDPRVVSRMEQVAESSQSHATALEAWLGEAREVRAEVLAGADAELHEQRVQAVLEGLDQHLDEDPRARPNPDLARITAGEGGAG